MNLRAVYILGLALLLNRPTLLLAQTDLTQKTPNPVVVSMIRVTLEFLATDTKAFGKVSNPVCKSCNTYEALTSFAKENQLRGGDDLVKDARREAKKILKENPPTLPSALQTFLISRVTNGVKSYRKQLPTFALFQQKLDEITNNQTIPAANIPTTPVAEAAPNTTGRLTDTTSEFTDVETPTYQSDDVPKPAQHMDYPTYLPLVTLVLSIINLIGLAILWNRKQDSPLKSVDNTILTTLTHNMEGLRTDINKLKGNKQSVTNITQQHATQLKQPQNQLQSVAPPASTPEVVGPVAEIPPVVTAQPAPSASTPNTFRQTPVSTPAVLYGRTADLGDGFSVSGLASKPDRDTVFEIHISPQTKTQADFRVSTSSDLQQLALSDPYSYLNDTCSYQTQPRSGSRIQTDKPGRLSLQADKWAIIEKAQISFQ